MVRPGERWWFPKDWAAKVLWTGLFTSVVLLALAFAWVEPVKESVPARVTRVDEYDATAAAVYAGEDVRQFPFLKQAIGRAVAANGTAETLFPERAWDGWKARVAEVQPAADPHLVVYKGEAWRIVEL